MLNEAAGFKVGDEVEVYRVMDSETSFIGSKGIIRSIKEKTFYNGKYTIHVKGVSCFNELEIRHTRKVANELNRRLYPSYTVEKDGYLYKKSCND